MLPITVQSPHRGKNIIRRTMELLEVDRMSKIFEEHKERLLQSTKASTISPKKHAIMVVGSTGLLGPYIVASLLSKNTIHDIVCVNRNPKGQERTLFALEEIQRRDHPDFSRLQFVVADITRPSLGFTNAQVEEMGARVDEIIFNAWNPNWDLPLAHFKPLLGAVQNAIDFSLSSRLHPRITFISSICAIGEWPRNHPEQPQIPEDVIQNCADAMATAYGESKRMAEMLLAQASGYSGLVTAIVRPGQIGGPSLYSITQRMWPRQGWIYSIINASKKKEAWPTHVQPLDWIPVDALAEGIATIVNSPRNENRMQVYNMVHPNPASWSLLLATLRVRFGMRVAEISLPRWLELFEPEGMKLFNFLKVGGRGREYDMVYENGNALKVLPSLAPITMDQLEQWLTGWDLELNRTAKL
jgi:thioester reductase-like protein